VTCEAPTIPNSKQRDERNGTSGSRWLDRHETIDKQIPHLDIGPWTPLRSDAVSVFWT
jgi:hypothetical protein